MRRFSPFLVFVLFALLIIPIAASAQTAPVPSDPGTIVSGVLTAFAGKKWTILVGFVLAGLIYVVRTYLLATWTWAQTKRGGAILALGIGVVGVIAAELIAGTASVMSIVDGILASWVASGMFSQGKALATPAPAVVVPPKA